MRQILLIYFSAFKRHEDSLPMRSITLHRPYFYITGNSNVLAETLSLYAFAGFLKPCGFLLHPKLIYASLPPVSIWASARK